MTPSRRRPVVKYLNTTYRVSERACLRCGASSRLDLSLREYDGAADGPTGTNAGDRADAGSLRLPQDPSPAESRGLEGGKKLVYRLYREEGLALCHKPGKRRRTALHRRDCFRPSDVNQAWSLNFVANQLAAGRRFRALTVVDVFTRESLAIEVGQKLKGEDVVRTLIQLRAKRGAPRFCSATTARSSPVKR